MDAQPTELFLARHVEDAERDADGPAVEGHAAVPQLEDVQRIAEDFGLVEEDIRSEEHTSELQSLMRNSYAVFCLKKKTKKQVQSGEAQVMYKNHSEN